MHLAEGPGDSPPRTPDQRPETQDETAHPLVSVHPSTPNGLSCPGPKVKVQTISILMVKTGVTPTLLLRCLHQRPHPGAWEPLLEPLATA